MFYCKFDEIAYPVVSTVKTCLTRSQWAGWAPEWVNCCFYFVSCIVKMTASIAKMSGFLEVAILHFSQSPLRKIVRIERLPARYVWPSWFHICTEGTGVEILTQPGKGSEKNFFPVIFPASFQTVPLPLSWFETHPRWPPVTQYAIVGLACEQSSYYHDYTLPEMHRERKFLGKTIQTGSSSRSVRNSCDRRNI